MVGFEQHSLAGAAAIPLHAGTGRCKPMGTRLPAGSGIAANLSPVPSPSLSLSTTTPNGINELGTCCGVYGTTFV